MRKGVVKRGSRKKVEQSKDALDDTNRDRSVVVIAVHAV